MKTLTRALAAIVIAGAAPHAAAQFWLDHVMITEVSWGDPDGLEITNFDSFPADLTTAVVKWNDSFGGTATSPPLGLTLQPGQSIVVTEFAGFVAELPPGTVLLTTLPSLPTTSQEITVALVDGPNVLDEVHVSPATGAHSGFSFGGLFYGEARRTTATSLSGAVGVERLWGLDTDGGLDWSEQSSRSFGLENRSSGPLGTDPDPVRTVKINEISASPRYVELRNADSVAVDLTGFYLLVVNGQGGAISRVGPLPTLVLPAGGFVVLGNNATPPGERPPSVPYLNVGALGSGLGSGSAALSMVLYDQYGRVADAVRTTAPGSELVHNFPRPPAHYSAFFGAAGTGFVDSVARSSATDTDRGTDWNPASRSMGLANTGFLTLSAGFGQSLDVRLHEGASNGSTVILAGGAPRAGYAYYFFISIGHSGGTGPFFGLGSDAISNWLVLSGVPPFAGVLDAQGSARWDFPPNSLPPGVALDFLFYASSPTDFVHTKVLAFDT